MDIEKISDWLLKKFKASGLLALLAFIIGAFTALPTRHNAELLVLQGCLLAGAIAVARREE